ncbi:hypothetical protein MMPV_007517 [Pyropia vietnamensis]
MALVPTEFVYVPTPPGAAAVAVVGDWTEWTPLPMRRRRSAGGGGVTYWVLTTGVPAGRIEYCWLVDGVHLVSWAHPKSWDGRTNCRVVVPPGGGLATAAPAAADKKGGWGGVGHR